MSYINNLREKFSPGPGFEPGFQGFKEDYSQITPTLLLDLLTHGYYLDTEKTLYIFVYLKLTACLFRSKYIFA